MGWYVPQWLRRLPRFKPEVSRTVGILMPAPMSSLLPVREWLVGFRKKKGSRACLPGGLPLLPQLHTAWSALSTCLLSTNPTLAWQHFLARTSCPSSFWPLIEHTSSHLAPAGLAPEAAPPAAGELEFQESFHSRFTLRFSGQLFAPQQNFFEKNWLVYQKSFFHAPLKHTVEKAATPLQSVHPRICGQSRRFTIPETTIQIK